MASARLRSGSISSHASARSDTRVADGAQQELEPTEPRQMLRPGFQKELAHHREHDRTEDQSERPGLHHQSPVSCRIRSLSVVRAHGKRTTETHFT